MRPSCRDRQLWHGLRYIAFSQHSADSWYHSDQGPRPAHRIPCMGFPHARVACSDQHETSRTSRFGREVEKVNMEATAGPYIVSPRMLSVRYPPRPPGKEIRALAFRKCSAASVWRRIRFLPTSHTTPVSISSPRDVRYYSTLKTPSKAKPRDRFVAACHQCHKPRTCPDSLSSPVHRTGYGGVLL